ncbi:MAG: hypothetical protein ABIF82_04270, partial [Planctomycetota bacterium]
MTGGRGMCRPAWLCGRSAGRPDVKGFPAALVEQMQALVRFGMGDGDIRLADVPEPRPAPNEVKIEV